ncbi:MAG: hypothetical protein M3Y23_04390, partial [Actinomycetota bacterium]|nr:hypothetical protein [Actinomycetota bacterium]
LELRHEGLLKVFFADAVDRGHRAELIRGIADQHREKLKQLRQVEAGLENGLGECGDGNEEPACDLVLRFGLDFQEWVIAWCEREIERNGA